MANASAKRTGASSLFNFVFCTIKHAVFLMVQLLRMKLQSKISSMDRSCATFLRYAYASSSVVRHFSRRKRLSRCSRSPLCFLSLYINVWSRWVLQSEILRERWCLLAATWINQVSLSGCSMCYTYHVSVPTIQYPRSALTSLLGACQLGSALLGEWVWWLYKRYVCHTGKFRRAFTM